MAERTESTRHPIPNLGAVILCGGKSSRMGTDKSQLSFQGDMLIGHVISCVAQVASKIVISGECKAKISKGSLPLVFVQDEITGVGPLEGIRVGLQELATSVEFAFVTGCDVPLIEPRLISHLFELIGSHRAVVPVGNDHVYGMAAIYRTDIAEEIQHMINRKEYRVKELVNEFDTLTIEIESLRKFDSELNSFMNINDREDYQQLQDRYGRKKESKKPHEN